MEWQLLLDAEAIRIGDQIIVELDSGDTVMMKLITYTDKKVYLRAKTGDLIKFNAETLESKDEDALIVGKA
jgi:hypothetical protein